VPKVRYRTDAPGESEQSWTCINFIDRRSTMNNPLGLRILTTTLAGVMTISMVACSKPADSTNVPTSTSNPPSASTNEAAASSTTIGTKLDDSVITTQVKAALLADPDIKGLDITVNTRKGEVQLSGFVDSQSQMDRAATVAQGIEGVTQVTSQMTLKK
jgi:hyperosmotically inducible periplasmic protein